MRAVAFVALALWASSASAAETSAVASVAANPVRKVVNLLQSMQKKIEAEGEREEELFTKFKCYCTKGDASLNEAIAAAEAHKPETEAAINDADAGVVRLTAEIQSHEAERADANGAIAKATAMRSKDAAAYAAGKTTDDANIEAIQQAIAALRKGMAGGSFLQTGLAATLRRLANAWAAPSSEDDRDTLLVFLSGSSASPQSAEIVGILEQMLESFDQDRVAAASAESAAIEAFEALVAAKKKEIKAQGAAIEAKQTRKGELAVEAERLRGDLTAEQTAYLQDKDFLRDLTAGCAKKTAEYEEHKKLRAEELLAIAETIKVLNDDEALELFKQTLPSAAASSLVEVRVRGTLQRRAALASLGKAADPRLDLIALALHGKKIGFEKIIGMIDQLVATLKQEQQDDEAKQAYCNKELDSADDSKKELEKAIADGKAGIDDKKAAIETVAKELAALQSKIADLDQSVADATAQRKAEHAEFTELQASHSAAKQLLRFAKNRLQKFYNPKLYVAPPKPVLSREDQIYSGFGGEVTTAAPGGIAGTGISVGFLQVATARLHARRSAADPGAAPETGDYAAKSQESTGVIAMMDLLIRDLDKELVEASTEEKDAQASYEKTMADSRALRAQDTKTITAKQGAKADVESDLQEQTESTAASVRDLGAHGAYISSLHAECDWLLNNFAVRKEARAGEVQSLSDAKAVLSGASFSLF